MTAQNKPSGQLDQEMQEVVTLLQDIVHRSGATWRVVSPGSAYRIQLEEGIGLFLMHFDRDQEKPEALVLSYSFSEEDSDHTIEFTKNSAGFSSLMDLFDRIKNNGTGKETAISKLKNKLAATAS